LKSIVIYAAFLSAISFGLFACTKPVEKKETVTENKIVTNLLPAKIHFDTTAHDFGELVKGEKAEFRFQFKNTGQQNLIVTEVRVQCGCTAADYTREPIKSGQNGYVQVVFNSESYTGNVFKSLKVFSNSGEEPVKLEISAFVKTSEILENNY
jgi:hypothetical protein